MAVGQKRMRGHARAETGTGEEDHRQHLLHQLHQLPPPPPMKQPSYLLQRQQQQQQQHPHIPFLTPATSSTAAAAAGSTYPASSHSQAATTHALPSFSSLASLPVPATMPSPSSYFPSSPFSASFLPPPLHFMNSPAPYKTSGYSIPMSPLGQSPYNPPTPQPLAIPSTPSSSAIFNNFLAPSTTSTPVNGAFSDKSGSMATLSQAALQSQLLPPDLGDLHQRPQFNQVAERRLSSASTSSISSSSASPAGNFQGYSQHLPTPIQKPLPLISIAGAGKPLTAPRSSEPQVFVAHTAIPPALVSSPPATNSPDPQLLYIIQQQRSLRETLEKSEPETLLTQHGQLQNLMQNIVKKIGSLDKKKR